MTEDKDRDARTDAFCAGVVKYCEDLRALQNAYFKEQPHVVSMLERRLYGLLGRQRDLISEPFIKHMSAALALVPPAPVFAAIDHAKEPAAVFASNYVPLAKLREAEALIRELRGWLMTTTPMGVNKQLAGYTFVTSEARL